MPERTTCDDDASERVSERLAGSCWTGGGIEIECDGGGSEDDGDVSRRRREQDGESGRRWWWWWWE